MSLIRRSLSGALLPLGSSVLAAVFSVWWIGDGIHYNTLRSSNGAHTTSLQVDRVEKSCFKLVCHYTSVGHYIDPSGSIVTDVTVEPSYDAAQRGTINVLVSPTHPREAIPPDYTGAGYIAAGIVSMLIAVLVCCATIAIRRRRYARLSRIDRFVTSSETLSHPETVQGILHGPGISPYAGIGNIEIGPQDISATIADMTHTIRFSDVIVAAVGGAPQHTGGAPTPMGWQTTTITTATGTFYLTCSSDYLPLLRKQLEHQHPA